MNEQSASRIWAMRLTFCFIVCLVLFFHLLPLETTARYWIGPDLILAFACAWSLRRPEYVPAVLLAVAFLFADLILSRPPGLWAVLALLACESLKSRARSLRDSSFFGEWIAVCFAVIFVAVGYRVVLMITLIDLPGFGLSVIELVATLLIYPMVVGLTHAALGVRKPSPGELDAGGSGL